MNIRGKDVHISYKGLRQRIRPQEHERDGGECRMTIWDTIFKAVFVVAVPITLAVYACVYVGERVEHDVARPRPPRRRPPGR